MKNVGKLQETLVFNTDKTYADKTHTLPQIDVINS